MARLSQTGTLAAPHVQRPLSQFEVLPKKARLKLAMIAAAATDARDNAASMTKKLNDMVGRASLQSEEGILDELIEGTRKRREVVQNEYRALSDLHGNLTRFVNRLGTARIRPYEAPRKAGRVRLLKDAAVALQDQRDAIRSIQFEMRAARQAPLPIADRKDRAKQYLAALAERSRPGIEILQTGQISITVGPGVSNSIIGGLDAERMIGAVVALVGVDHALKIMMPGTAKDLPNAMSAEQRRDRLGELAFKLLQAEREEESIICRAAEKGLNLLRRADANPIAVLELDMKV